MLVDAHPPARITSARVSSASPDQPPPGAPTLCLGEARRRSDLRAAARRRLRRRRASCPTSAARSPTVAVTAARHGAHVALAGGAGDDPWGRWLRDRLEREGVGTVAVRARAGSADAARDRVGRARRRAALSRVRRAGGQAWPTRARGSARGGGPGLGGAVHRLEHAVRRGGGRGDDAGPGAGALARPPGRVRPAASGWSGGARAPRRPPPRTPASPTRCSSAPAPATPR